LDLQHNSISKRNTSSVMENSTPNS